MESFCSILEILMQGAPRKGALRDGAFS